MNDIVKIENTELTMSSREIADLVESRHDKVKQSIERLAARGVIQLPPLGEVKNHLGQTVQEYRLIKRDSYVVVAQLSPEFTARLVDRWQQLESQSQHQIPQTYSEALRLAANLVDENLELRQEVDEIKPQALALKRISLADGSECITDAAKTLQMRPKDLFAFLSLHRWIYRRAGGKSWVAYEDKRQMRLLEHKTTIITTSDGVEHARDQVLITAKGLARLAVMLNKEKEVA